jgi:crotonobetainyl-CoA:carnitine CoA-transferase CaiB-like acyl-CoA transferase
MPRVIPSAPGRDDQYFWAGVAEGRLLGRHCAGCSYLQHPPRRAHDGELAAELGAVFASRPAREWLDVLDAAGVPCEVSDPDYPVRLFADPEAERRQLTSSFRHRMVGTMKLGGLSFQLSGSPGVIKGGPLWPGQDTKVILAELGYTPEEIAKLIESGAVDDTSL